MRLNSKKIPMFNWQRFYAVLRARNIEFFRDKAAVSWNIIFPILLVAGFAFLFSDDSKIQFKAAVYQLSGNQQIINNQQRLTGVAVESDFFKNQFVQFVPVQDLSLALTKLKHHQFDMVMVMQPESKNTESRQSTKTIRYWINSYSQKGEILEKILQGSFALKTNQQPLEKQTVSGQEVPYVDWVLPGILALNMMFSCLFGVGFTIVRYRKNGVLKRFKGTPLTTFEFLSAQVISRLMLVVSATIVVFIGSSLIVNPKVEGSYFVLALVFLLGALCLISLGLIIAARTTSEEFANGILNVISWPMLIFSGVWFSLEGLHPAGQMIAYVLPLTHVIEAARQVMNDGHGLLQIIDHISVLLGMTIVFLVIGTLSFKWDRF